MAQGVVMGAIRPTIAKLLLRRKIDNAYEAGNMEACFAAALALANAILQDEDLAQDAVLVAWKKHEMFNGGSKFSTWLTAIIRRVRAESFRGDARCVCGHTGDSHRHVNADMERPCNARGCNCESFSGGDVESIDSVVIEFDDSAAIEVEYPSAAAQLAFTLKALGYDNAEIGAVFGISMKTVENNLASWRKKVKISRAA